MRRTKQIAIILSDTIQSIGIQSLLYDYFAPVSISHFSVFESLSESKNDTFDYFFTNANTFLLNADFFMPRKNKTIILTDNTNEPKNSSFHQLFFKASQETIIEQLQIVFSADVSNSHAGENNKELSNRELDVLKLIATGYTNKDMADKLSISLNTVLSHRKNITAKLGIKTVSGLTFFAIMNGIISPENPDA